MCIRNWFPWQSRIMVRRGTNPQGGEHIMKPSQDGRISNKQGAEVPPGSPANDRFLLISECSLSLCMCPQGADKLFRGTR